MHHDKLNKTIYGLLIMTSAKDLSNATNLGSIHTAVDVTIVTPGAGALAKPARWIRVKTAGTVTVTTFAGNSVVLNFADGETRFVGATHITAATGPTIIEAMA